MISLFEKNCSNSFQANVIDIMKAAGPELFIFGPFFFMKQKQYNSIPRNPFIQFQNLQKEFYSFEIVEDN
jgi:hypothetical protein